MSILQRITTSTSTSYMPNWFWASDYFRAKTVVTAADRYTVLSPTIMQVDVGGTSLTNLTQQTLDLSLEATWDTISGTDYRTASNRAGKDLYIYACIPVSGTIPKLLVSINSTYPSGYSANTSRKIAGFHCLCVACGTNVAVAHSLRDYAQGDILPASVWDLRWKSNSLIGNVGQVYDAGRQIWCAIYHPSGTAGSPTIIFAGTILDTIDWNNSVDACAVLGMRLARDSEFQSVAAGSNELTNIYGGADPVTVGGYVDTAGTRMISNIGVEGCAGQMYQWLDEQSYMFDAAASHTHAWTVNGDAQSNVVSAAGSADLAPAWAWQAASGSKGSIYKQGTYGSVKAISGGTWTTSTYSGSRNRRCQYPPWDATHDWISFRPVARHIVKETV